MWCVHPSHSPACPRGVDLVLHSAPRWVELETSMAVSIGLGDRVHEKGAEGSVTARALASSSTMDREQPGPGLAAPCGERSW